MRINQIVEAETDDQAEREEAERVHTAVTNWLKKNEESLSERLLTSSLYGGCYVLPMRRVLPEYNNLLIFFVRPNEHSGMGSTKDGHKALVISGALLEANNLRHLPTRFGTGGKKRFVHEFAHYLLDLRYSGSNTVDKYHSGNISDHYNDPSELQAYYVEATHDLWRTMKAIAPHAFAREKYLAMTASEFTEYAMGFFVDDFVEALTAQNRKRIRKRLARFFQETVRPMLASYDDKSSSDLASANE